VHSGVEALIVFSELENKSEASQGTCHIFFLSGPKPPGPIERRRRGSQSTDIKEWQCSLDSCDATVTVTFLQQIVDLKKAIQK